MPHKNPRCEKCEYKMEHKEWLDETRPYLTIRGVNIYTDSNRVIQKRVVKCPRCGNERFDWKTRVLKAPKK